MNPFVLLIKPMMAVGFLVTKMAVAAGMVATEGGAPPASHPSYEQVRVAVMPDEHGIGHMEVEMPNGELFELADVDGDGSIGEDFVEASDSAPGPFKARRSRAGGRTSAVSHGGEVVAMLESTLGRSMRCDVSLASEHDNGSARCTVNTGEVYQVTF
jgi:hypothetical protein